MIKIILNPERNYPVLEKFVYFSHHLTHFTSYQKIYFYSSVGVKEIETDDGKAFVKWMQ